MEKFGERLMPLLEEENVDLSGEPETIEVEAYFMREASSEAGD
jgi:hypothetical protein